MILLGLALATLAYGFAPGDTHTFRMEDRFEGYLPILGGNEGAVDIRMDLKVEGVAAKESERRLTCEVADFELKFNDVKMPLELEAVVDFFPKHAVDITGRGKTVKTEAKSSGLPIKLPGLEQDRLADITFIPLEWPEGPLAQDQTWQFERDFGGAPMRYEATVKKLTDDQAVIALVVSQSFSTLEDENRNAVKERSEAASTVDTQMRGTGTATFDRKLGVFTLVEMSSTATSTVRALSGKGDPVERKLALTHKVTRVPASAGGKEALRGEN